MPRPDRRSAAPANGSGWPTGGSPIGQPERVSADWAYGTAGDAADAAVREAVAPTTKGRGRALVIGCGALARELLAVTEPIPGLDVACLAPDLHNRPDGIPSAVRNRIRRARADGYERVFVAYADCGTGGLLEPVLADEGVERLAGAHCYEVFAGSDAFAAMADHEPGTFWLTDFLARNFERLVIRGLGIDRHPELLGTYFAHYARVVYLSQTDDPDLVAMARRAADRLGLAFEHRRTGVVHLAAPIQAWAAASAARPPRVQAAGAHDRIRVGTDGERADSAGPARATERVDTNRLESVALSRGANRPTVTNPSGVH